MPPGDLPAEAGGPTDDNGVAGRRKSAQENPSQVEVAAAKDAGPRSRMCCLDGLTGRSYWHVVDDLVARVPQSSWVILRRGRRRHIRGPGRDPEALTAYLHAHSCLIRAIEQYRSSSRDSHEIFGDLRVFERSDRQRRRFANPCRDPPAAGQPDAVPHPEQPVPPDQSPRHDARTSKSP